MKDPLHVERDGERRSIPCEEFPVSCGGAETEIAVDSSPVPGPVLWIGEKDGDLFAENGNSGVVWSCNGLPVHSSQWLHDGDEIRIANSRIEVRSGEDGFCLTVQRLADDETTIPPAITATREFDADGSTPRTIRPVEFRRIPKPETATGGRPLLRPATALTVALIVLLVGGAGFVFTLRSVEIVVSPEPERLAIEQQFPVIPLAGRYLLRSGEYRVVAEKVGFERLEQAIVVGDGPNQRFEFVLERLPDEIELRTGPVTGGRVFVNGLEVGVTPLARFPLAPGKHEIRIRAERHEEHIERLTVDGGGQTIVVDVAWAPLWAEVSFRSKPGGAIVLVDGERIGQTPMTGELLEGRRRIEYRLAGFKSFSESVPVVARTPLELREVRLDPADAVLRIRSEPEGAMLTVDGEFIGQTPVEVALDPGRTVELELAKPGYAGAERSIALKSGEDRTVTVELEARFGELTVEADPVDALLYVDGLERGAANQRIRLIAVPHEIEVRKPGYVTFRTQVTPKPGVNQAVRAILKTEEQLREERTPPRVKTSRGQELVLVAGGKFGMGAARREPGRRANETQREVELTRRFYISTTEISNRDFRRFDPAHLSGAAAEYNLEIDTHPVVRVSWEDAALYCNWLSEQESLKPAYEKVGDRIVTVRPATLGYRLPTEAEWAWAARYDVDGDVRKYPWGDKLPVTDRSGNYADVSADGVLSTTLDGYDDGFGATAPVNGFEPDSRGLFNVGGNVAEWVQDIYTVYSSGAPGVAIDPLGPLDGELHVIRGSSWMDATVSELRLTYRDYSEAGRPDLGFRIARYAE